MNILITGCGFPGTYSMVKSLRESFHGVEIYGIDSNDSELARLHVDYFEKCPKAENEDYRDFIFTTCIKLEIDVILQTVTAEIPKLQSILKDLEIYGTKIPMCRKTKYENLNNKWLILHTAEHHGIPVPKYKRVFDEDELWMSVFDCICCIKPIYSNGGRGFRIIDHDSENSYYTEKYPTRGRYTDIKNQLPETFTIPILLMEYLPGIEYTVDCLADNGKMIYAVPRTRDTVRDGISFIATTVNHKNIIEHCRKLIEVFRVHGPCGFQFKEDENGTAKIIECNPRIQGGSILAVKAGADIFGDAVRLALGQQIKQPDIKWGMKMVRYYDEKFI